MRRFLILVVLGVLAAVAYSVLSDPDRKEKVLGTIEGSTGVDLSAEPEKILEDTGRVVGDKAGQLFRELGDTLSDPALYRSLEKWGRDALDKLDEADLERLKEDLRQESESGGSDFNSILERYLGEAVNS